MREDLIVPLADIDTERMLEFWRWLIPASHRPLFATALGDLFLADDGGRILWLDVGSGELKPVAPGEHEFDIATADPDNDSLWFGTVLVDQLLAAGKVRKPGECYSYLQLPLLGGEYKPSNFRVYDVVTYFRVWGPILEQLWNLPDGATVVFEVTESRPPTGNSAPDGDSASPT